MRNTVITGEHRSISSHGLGRARRTVLISQRGTVFAAHQDKGRAAVLRQVCLERLVADLSISFAGLPASCIDAAIEDGLRKLVEVLEVDVGAFYQSAGDELEAAHVWPTQRLEQADYLSGIARSLRRKGVIRLSKREVHSDEKSEKEFLTRLGRRSAVLVGVIRDGSLQGALMLGSSQEEIALGDKQAEQLGILGAVFVQAFARKRADERLCESDRLSRAMAQANLRELSGKVIRALEEERARIARDLHDDLSQRLALMGIEVEQIMQSLGGKQNNLRRRLRDLWGLNQEISSEVRRLSHQLHPAKVEYLGLVAAVRGFCNELSERQGLRISFKQFNVPSSLPKDEAICIYRVVQEALRNVVKHSGAQGAQVVLSGSDGAINLCISDEGSGFDPYSEEAKTGIGLIGMRERLLLIGGEICIDSQPSRGTRISVRVPLDEQACSANVPRL